MDTNVVIKGAEAFSEIDPYMQLITMLTFLHIAQRGITNQQDIALLLGLSGGIVSRNVAYWIDNPRLADGGLGFIERAEDPTDRRSKILKLTLKGKKFYDTLRSNNDGLA